MEERNLKWHGGEISRTDRAQAAGHQSCVLWFTGLSGSGKSTVARRVESKLHERGVRVYVLDGDNVRLGLNSDLGFGGEARKENIRRVGEVARLFVDAGMICIVAFISPYREDRARARALLDAGDFAEVWAATPIETCEARDPKKLYARARAGEIPNFTGISAPYEAPQDAEVQFDTTDDSVDACAEQVIAWLEETGKLPAA